MILKENVEMDKNLKQKLKLCSVFTDETMTDLIIKEVKNIIHNKEKVPWRERAKPEQRTHLVLNVDKDLKYEINLYALDNDIKIRDIWTEGAIRVVEKTEVDACLQSN